MKTSKLKLLLVGLISFWLVVSTKVFAQEDTALPSVDARTNSVTPA